MVLNPHRRGERGAIALVVALMATVLFVLSAMVVDLGQARMERRQAQNTADAAALAGGNVLFPTGSTTPDYVAATAAAKSFAERNLPYTPDWSTCSDPAALPIASGTPCISFQKTGSTARVRVMLPSREVRTTFARVIGIDSISVTAAARATLKVGGASDCGLCVLGSGATHDLQNGDATVHGGGIHFNGSVQVSSNGLVATDGTITVEGTAGGPSANYTPNPLTSQPPIIDPLAEFLPAPDMTGLTAKTNPCSQGPGKYGSVNLRNMSCTLSPGVYVITGTWDMAGNSSTVLAGTGVTLYFACGTPSAVRACASPGEVGGTIDNSGQGRLAISAPTSGPYQGMAIWYDRMNTATLRMTGNGQGGYSGTLYAASAKLLVNGNGCSTHLNALIIVKDLEFNGNPSCMQSTYTQASNVQIPPGVLHLDQ